MSKFSLPKLYAITDSSLSGLSHAAQVESLCAGGARLIQLREKRLPPNAFYEAAMEAVAVARRYGAKLLINDRVDIALSVGADGVHLGQDDLPAEAARALLSGNAIIGLSTHNATQAQKAIQLPIDYLAVGPIFPTSTKSDTSPIVGLEGLKRIRSEIGDFPLVAIGGIQAKNAPTVLKAGADSVAVVSSLISDASQIETRTRAFVSNL